MPDHPLGPPRWSAHSVRGAGRTRNADAWAALADGTRLSVAVADGVGALPSSPVASAAAAHAAALWLIEHGQHANLVARVGSAVLDALRGDSASGATTLAAAICDGARATMVTVGDTEVLSIGAAGPAERLNELDHLPSQPNILLSWIDGTLVPEPHVLTIEVLPVRLCLLTDGVTSALGYDRIAEIARGHAADAAAHVLVEAAQAAGAQDDVTAIVIGWGER